MKIPTITGTIDRRILINYQADKAVIEKFLPVKFRPKLVKDKAIVGICLIRLKNIRPKGLPFNIGISSENGAHRIAVEWDEDGEVKQGVYVPRRDTSSKLNSLAGLELKTKNWEVSQLTVIEVKSSFFQDETIFPKGTIKFDNALLMKNIDHEWNSKNEIRE